MCFVACCFSQRQPLFSVASAVRRALRGGSGSSIGFWARKLKHFFARAALVTQACVFCFHFTCSKRAKTGGETSKIERKNKQTREEKQTSKNERTNKQKQKEKQAKTRGKRAKTGGETNKQKQEEKQTKILSLPGN